MSHEFTSEEARQIVEEDPERFKRLMADPEARIELTRVLLGAGKGKGKSKSKTVGDKRGGRGRRW